MNDATLLGIAMIGVGLYTLSCAGAWSLIDRLLTRLSRAYRQAMEPSDDPCDTDWP